MESSPPSPLINNIRTISNGSSKYDMEEDKMKCMSAINDRNKKLIAEKYFSSRPVWEINSDTLKFSTKYYMTDISFCVPILGGATAGEIAKRIVECLSRLSIQVDYESNTSASANGILTPPPIAHCMTMDMIEFEVQLFIVDSDKQPFNSNAGNNNNDTSATQCLVEIRRLHGCSIAFAQYKEALVNAAISPLPWQSSVQHEIELGKQDGSLTVATAAPTRSCIKTHRSSISTRRSNMDMSERSSAYSVVDLCPLTSVHDDGTLTFSQIDEDDISEEEYAINVMKFALSIIGSSMEDTDSHRLCLEYLIFVTSGKDGITEPYLSRRLAQLVLTESEETGIEEVILIRKQVESLLSECYEVPTNELSSMTRHLAFILLCNLLEQFMYDTCSHIPNDDKGALQRKVDDFVFKPWLLHKVIPYLINELHVAKQRPHLAYISCKCLGMIVIKMPELISMIHHQGLIDGLEISHRIGIESHLCLSHHTYTLLSYFK